MKTQINLKSFIGIFMLVLFLAVTFNSFSLKQTTKWVAPETAKKLKNPVASNAASIAEGKTLYAQFCKSCHGVKGLGDGPKAAQLEKKCGDFSKADFQKQTDGEMYWKTTEGKDPMPTFKKKIADDQDRWKIVNYMRTLAVK